MNEFIRIMERPIIELSSVSSWFIWTFRGCTCAFWGYFGVDERTVRDGWDSFSTTKVSFVVVCVDLNGICESWSDLRSSGLLFEWDGIWDCVWINEVSSFNWFCWIVSTVCELIWVCTGVKGDVRSFWIDTGTGFSDEIGTDGVVDCICCSFEFWTSFFKSSVSCKRAFSLSFFWTFVVSIN